MAEPLAGEATTRTGRRSPFDAVPPTQPPISLGAVRPTNPAPF